MRRTKRLICLLLCTVMLLSSLLSLFGCNKRKYEPIESTAEEKRVVYTLSIGEKSYEVRYELYRALFLNMRGEYDGGDPSVWSGEGKDEYIAAIDSDILKRICEIYSAFALCDELGIDLYSSEVEDMIYSYLVMSIEGCDGVVGYGSYEKYLEELRKMNLNYGVQELMYRYSVAMDLIDDYYIGTYSSEDIVDSVTVGKLTYTREDVEAFYFGEGCVRVLRAAIDPSNYYEDQVQSKINGIYSLICEAAPLGETSVAYAMINNTTMPGPEVERGFIISRHNLDKAYYSEMTEVAFDLGQGEVSRPILVNDGQLMAYYIMYKAEKSEKHLNECYSDIAKAFLYNEVGSFLDQRATQLLSGAVSEDVLKELDRSSISME